MNNCCENPKKLPCGPRMMHDNKIVPGPISYGADGGGVGDVEGGAWEDLRGARFAWIGGQLSWWGLQPDRALQVTTLFIFLDVDFFCTKHFLELFL